MHSYRQYQYISLQNLVLVAEDGEILIICTSLDQVMRSMQYPEMVSGVRKSIWLASFTLLLLLLPVVFSSCSSSLCPCSSLFWCGSPAVWLQEDCAAESGLPAAFCSCSCSSASLCFCSSSLHCDWLYVCPQEDCAGTQPRVVYMHKCMELEYWPATAIVSQLHLAEINLSHVVMDTKSKPAYTSLSSEVAHCCTL